MRKQPRVRAGDIVCYMFTSQDVEAINRRRTTGPEIAERIKAGTWPHGAQAHIGPPVEFGMAAPMIVTRVHNSGGSVNGRCILDGTDDYWVSGVHQRADAGPGAWWFEREDD